MLIPFLFVAIAQATRSFLAIAIVSAPKNFEQRQTLRDTWLTEMTDLAVPIKYAFIVGKAIDPELNAQVEREAKQYKDLLIMVNLMDGYRQLARKTQVAFRWAFEGDGSEFLLKTDDDSYVKLRSLIQDLREYYELDPKHASLYLGRMFAWSQPFREPGHPHYVSYRKWPFGHYPLFGPGCGYIVGREIGEYLLGPGKEIMKKTLPVEDVTVGWWIHTMAEQYNQTINYQIERRIVPLRSWGCFEDDLIRHQYKKEEMTWMFANNHSCLPSSIN